MRLQPSPFSKIMHRTNKELFFMAIPSEVEAVEYAPINNVQGFPRTGATFVPKRLRKKIG